MAMRNKYLHFDETLIGVSGQQWSPFSKFSESSVLRGNHHLHGRLLGHRIFTYQLFPFTITLEPKRAVSIGRDGRRLLKVLLMLRLRQKLDCRRLYIE
jgi:hypothetical protein